MARRGWHAAEWAAANCCARCSTVPCTGLAGRLAWTPSHRRMGIYLSDLNILYSQLIWTFSRQCVTRLGSGFVLLKGNGVTLPPLPVRGAISSPFGVASRGPRRRFEESYKSGENRRWRLRTSSSVSITLRRCASHDTLPGPPARCRALHGPAMASHARRRPLAFRHHVLVPLTRAVCASQADLR